MSEVGADAAPFAGPDHGIAFTAAVRVWARIAALSFGGPAGQIAVMHRILVDEKRWVGDRRFLQALNYCMLLPGPEAHQLTIYLGWLLHGVRGGVVAGTLFVLPGFVSILALSLIYAAWGRTDLVAGLFFGLKAAVLAIVLQAVVRIGGRALKNHALRAIAAVSFVAIFFFDVPFPLIVLTAGLVGYLGGRAGSAVFLVGGGHGGAAGPGLADADSALGAATPRHARGGFGWSLRVAGAFLLLWAMPVGLVVLLTGWDSVFARIAIFFSQMAMVTFGGAYAVLAYVAQEAVQNFGWLSPGEMLDGLGMAETTPGPLIQVVQFVAFLGAFRDPGGLDPWLAACLGAVLATWVTFVPSFLWIFLGAPHIERLRGNAALNGALSAITASVVGVILNLAMWFALHVVFDAVRPWSGYGLRLDLPVPGSLNLAALALTLGAVFAVFRLKSGIAPVLAASGALGLVWYAAGGA